MNRFDGHEMTSRYLWAEGWQWREAHSDMRMVPPPNDRVVGFQHDGDAWCFREAMRERVEALSPSLRPERRPELPSGVLKELAELHGFDGHEPSRRPLPTDDALPNGWNIARSKSKRSLAHAWGRRSARIPRMLPTADSALAAFRQLLQPSWPAEGTSSFLTQHHRSNT